MTGKERLVGTWGLAWRQKGPYIFVEVKRVCKVLLRKSCLLMEVGVYVYLFRHLIMVI